MKQLVRISGHLAALQGALAAQEPQSLAKVNEGFAELSAEYIRLGMQMSPKNAWRFGKLKDSAGGCQDVDVLAGALGLSSELHTLLLLVTFAADIGRLVIAIEHQKGNKARTQVAHGEASAEVLKQMGILGLYGTLAPAITTALAWHSKVNTPTLADVGNDSAAWVLCCLLRDLDMCSIIAGKAMTYVENPAEIERQLASNKLTMAYAVSEDVLRQFERGEPIDRLSCKTFPEWLLQFLAWRANFTFEETWEIATVSRGYYFVLRWMYKHFKPQNADQLRRILAAAENIYRLKYELE